ncbi:hypothetical protein L210DRAFT_2574033 [Boletus edulis BED1]|uniref:Uncharacterized protein n=1 Tax=Boletus edulis BED1 TaxID=1328754 RepID=A0AAD4BAQ6_BOLED|nr:hypothetical protein L210DRAFT_2574033 [Boletus edulis BED1]
MNLPVTKLLFWLLSDFEGSSLSQVQNRKPMQEGAKLHTYRGAFSHDGTEDMKRTYVQDLLRLNKEIETRGPQHNHTKEVTKRRHGSSNKIPVAVREAMKEAVRSFGVRMSTKDTANFVSMERE